MKKTLLFVAALSIAAAGAFAQPKLALPSRNASSSSNLQFVVPNRNATYQVDPKVNTFVAPEAVQQYVAGAPKKTADNGVIYYRPEGTLYRNFSENFGVYYMSMLVVPSYYDLTFKNGNNIPESALWSNGTSDWNEYTDEDKNLTYGLTSGYDGSYTYLPTISDGTTDFTLCESNQYSATYRPGFMVDSVANLMFHDYRTSSAHYGWNGSTSKHYLIGSGVYTREDVDYVMWGLEQEYPKPAAPMYIDNISMNYYSETGAVKEGGEIVLNILKLETIEGKDYITDTIAVLKATPADTAIYNVYESGLKTPSGAGYYGHITFQNKYEDDWGIETVEPVTLDSRFLIQITNLDDPLVDIGFLADKTSADDLPTEGVVQYSMAADSSTYNFWYGAGVALQANFHATFDHADAWDSAVFTLDDGTEVEVEGLNNFIAPIEGGVARVDNDEYNIPVAYINTCFDWKDCDELENYYIELPEWLSIEVDESNRYRQVQYSDGSFGQMVNGPTLLTITAEPLPEGVKGRQAELHIEGRGYISQVPIIVTQGEITNNFVGTKYDFAAVAAAGENPANKNGSAANGQAFYVWENADKADSQRQDFKGYEWAEGSVLPEVCHVWRRIDRINGNIVEGGLNCPNDREMVVDGLSKGAQVVIFYDATAAADGNKEIVYATGVSTPGTVATVNGETAVSGETKIASGSPIAITSTAGGYIGFKVFKGMVISMIVLTEGNGELDTAIRELDLNNGVVIENGQIYNLAGQRIAAPEKGQIYILNGKKFIEK